MNSAHSQSFYAHNSHMIKAYHQKLFSTFYATLSIDEAAGDENDQQLMACMGKLNKDISAQPEAKTESTETFAETSNNLGQWFIVTCIARYPHITPLIPRELFWFFGGECLHYIDEEESTRFQRIDEQVYEQSQQSYLTLDDISKIYAQ